MKITGLSRFFALGFFCWLGFMTAGLGQTPAAPELVFESQLNGFSAGSEIKYFSPDGRRFARLVGFSDQISVYDTETNFLISTFKISNGLPERFIAFSFDGEKIAIDNSIQGTEIYDVSSGLPIRSFHLRGLFEVDSVKGLAFTPDDKFLITGGYSLRIWDAATGRLLNQLNGHNGAVVSLAVSRDGKLLATAGEDQTIRFWSLPTAKEIKQITVTGPFKQLMFNRSGETLSGINTQQEAVSWNVATGKSTGKFKLSSFLAQFSGDGETINVLEENGTQSQYQVVTGKKITPPAGAVQAKSYVERATTNSIYHLSFIPHHGGLLLYGSKSMRIPFAAQEPVFVFDSEVSYVEEAVYSPNGKFLLIWGLAGGLKLVESQTGKILKNFPAGYQKTSDLLYRGEVKRMAVSDDGEVFYDDSLPETIKNLGTSQKMENYSLSADGKTMLVVTKARAIVFDTASGREKSSIPLPTYNRAALSPNGKLVAANDGGLSGTQDRTTIWDVETNVRVRDLMQAKVSVSDSANSNAALTFSPDGKILACANLDGFIEFWNAETGERSGVLPGQRGLITNLRFDQSGEILASLANGEIALWNVSERRKIASIYTVGDQGWAVIAPDARFEATPEAQKFMHWQQGGKPFAFEKFSQKFATPGLLAKLLAENAGGPVRFKNALPLAPLVTLQATAKQPLIGEEAEIKVEVIERGGGFSELQLRQNGKLVGIGSLPAFKKEANGNLTKVFRLPLVPGTNLFSVLAFAANNSPGESSSVKIEAGHQIISTRRETVLPVGQRGQILALKTSPDGRFLASLSNERTIKLWDLQTGKEQRTLTTDQGFFSALAFSPDGKSLATGLAFDSPQKTQVEVTVWDLQSGLPIQTFEEFGDNSNPGITDLIFSHNGKLLVIGAGTAQATYYGINKNCTRLIIRDLETNRQIRIFSAGKRFLSPGFDPGDQNLIVVDDKTIKYIDWRSGQTVKKIEGGTDAIVISALSPTRQLIATAGKSEGVKLWETFAQTGAAKFMIPVNGKDITDIAFSPDEKFVLTSGSNGAIQLWNVADGSPAGTINTSEKSTHAMAFGLLGQILATAHDDGVVKIWDAESKSERRTLSRQIEPVKSLVFDQTNGQLVSLTQTGNSRWQLERLRQTNSEPLNPNLAELLTKLGTPGKSYVLSPDFSTFVYSENEGKTLKIIRLDPNLAIEAPNLPSEFVWLARLVAVIEKNPNAGISLKNLPVGTDKNSFLSQLAVSDNGKFVAAVGDSGIRIWKSEDGSEKVFAEGNNNSFISSICLNNDGTQAALGNQFGGVFSWDLTQNKFRRIREDNPDYYTEPVSILAFSPDGKLLSGVLSDGSIKIWEIDPGEVREKFNFTGHQGGTNSIVFHPSKPFLFSGGADGRTIIWDLKTGLETVSLVTLGARDFLAYTPEGFYTASKKAALAISVRTAGKLLPFEQFDGKYNRPDLVLEKVGLSGPEVIKIYRQAVEKRLKRLGTSIEAAARQTSQAAAPPDLSFVAEPPLVSKERRLTVKVKATEDNEKIKLLQITANGVPVSDEKGFEGKTATREREIEIELQRGANQVKITAVGENGALGVPLEFNTRLQIDYLKPTLYLVAIGVSDYPENNLNYAAKDADDVAKFFESKEPRFNQVKVLRLLNKDATRENIESRARTFLAPAGVEDEVIIFVAGHGMLDKDLNYYFGTIDIDFQNPAVKGLPYESLEKLLNGPRARKKLLLMDTCHAGEVDRESTSPVSSPVPATDSSAKKTSTESTTEDNKSFIVVRGSKSVQVKNRDQLGLRSSFELLSELFSDFRNVSGSQIIAAASGMEVAYERGELKNGVFTHFLLEALNSEKADKNGDGKIQVFELQDYVNRQVSESTKGVQTPIMRAENIEFDFAVF
jgi:WD40 repeat protein